MYPGLKPLDLRPLRRPWTQMLSWAFRNPAGVLDPTDGPPGRMKNRDTPAHPQVYGPLRQGLGPCVHDDLGTLSPSPWLFGSRRRRGAPFRSAPQSLTGEPFSVPTPSRTVPWPRVRSSCGTTTRPACQSPKLKLLKRWRFLPALGHCGHEQQLLGFRASRLATVILYKAGAHGRSAPF
jgi:hypothetical protein